MTPASTPDSTLAPLPAVQWQVTGNHWLSLPCIHPHDGAIHAVGLLHRGARSAVEFAGAEGFVDGTGPALARPVIRVDGAAVELARAGIAWERALHWLPTFTSIAGDLVVRGTVFAPFGQDADIAGAVYTLAFENRGKRPVQLEVGLEGQLGHRQLRVRTPRPAEDAHRVREAAAGVVILDGVA
ncbi:MAG TPA: hypothetical protein PK788_14385, partial [Gemmatimonadaceae bacterium]|nr:hypothetical protein [Gemmatimonadaceae bacterium]